MLLQFGNYRHALNECAVNIEQNGNFSPDRIYLGNTIRWTISGQLFADTPALLTAAGQALLAAYAPGTPQDATIFLDDGTTQSLYQLLNVGSIGGVRIIQGPSFPYESGAYTTFLPYAIILEAEYPNLGAEAGIIQWQETITIMGGQPRWVIRETLNGPPIRQQTHQQTKVSAVQTGSALGYFNWPNPPPPIWPNDFHADRSPWIRGAPQTMGFGIGQTYVQFPIFWNYEFESINQLAGLPHAKPSSIGPIAISPQQIGIQL